MMSSKRVIFISGSGKCGTSVIANAFYAAGFPMGTKDDLIIYEGSRGNVGGYWEHREILEINQRILAYNGIDWHISPPSLPLRIDLSLRQQMRSLTERLPDGFCCKEPRLVWTADLWREWFDEICLVAVFRNPAGFRRSIAHVWPERFSSDGDAEDSVEMGIWAAANRRLLELAEIFPCHWICFDDPVPVLKRRLAQIIRHLGRTFNEHAFEDFYRPEERRFSSEKDIDESANQLPRPVTALYQQLRGRAGTTGLRVQQNDLAQSGANSA